MRLLFVSNLFPDAQQPLRGLDNANLLHALKGSCQIRVLCPRPTLSLGWKSPACRPQDEIFSPSYLPTRYLPKLGGLLNHHLMARALAPELRRGDFDAVLCSWLFPDACAVAAHVGSKPFVAIAQGSDVHQYLKSPLRRRAIRTNLSKARAIVTRSSELARLLVDAGVTHVRTIYNGVDTERFQPGSKEEARVRLGLPAQCELVLYVGNFLPVKNPFLLVDAHRALRKDRSRLFLCMLGSGPLERGIRVRAGEDVLLPGPKAPEQVALYMQAADLLCIPSLNEGVPNVLFEALSSGLPVVATDVGGIPEIHPDKTLLVRSGDVSALTQKIAEALDRPHDPHFWRENGLNYSWQRAASEYLSVLGQ